MGMYESQNFGGTCGASDLNIEFCMSVLGDFARGVLISYSTVQKLELARFLALCKSTFKNHISYEIDDQSSSLSESLAAANFFLFFGPAGRPGAGPGAGRFLPLTACDLRVSSSVSWVCS